MQLYFVWACESRAFNFCEIFSVYIRVIGSTALSSQWVTEMLFKLTY